MKKFFIPICFLLFAVFLCSSCGRPKGMTKEVYDLGKQALQLMEDYHSGKISSSDVNAPLENIKARLETIQNGPTANIKAGPYGLSNGSYASFITIDISSFLYNKDFEYASGDTYEAVQSLKDHLHK